MIVNQVNVRRQLIAYFSAIKLGGKINLLVYAPSGYGKTTIVNYIASSIVGVNNIEYVIGKLPQGGKKVAIIDEAHVIKGFEPIYRMMDEGDTSVILMSNILEFPEAIHTRVIPVVFKHYNEYDIAKIFLSRVKGPSKKFIASIAERFSLNPRITKNTAESLLYLYRKRKLTELEVLSGLKTLGFGIFSPFTQRYVDYLVSVGRPISLTTISGGIQLSEHMIKSEIEPFLLSRGYLEITSRGRNLTEKCYRKLESKKKGGCYV